MTVLMKIHSLDLRQRALMAWKKMGNKSQVCEIFGISRPTLDRWIELEHTDEFDPKNRKNKGGRPSSIKDLSAFKAFVEQSNFTNIHELVPLFEKTFGYPVAYEVIRRTLKRLSWSPAKKIFVVRKNKQLESEV